MPIKYRLNLKVLRFLALTVITLLIFCQTPAWGTIGIAEWEISTPGGNKIGNNDGLPSNVHTAIYRDYSTIYVKSVQEYGFYEGVIIGKAEKSFFWFNEKTKEVNYFSTQEQLCSKVKAKGLKLSSIYSFSQWLHYFIRYSLYFLIPFIILFTIHQRIQQQVALPNQVKTILKSPAFALQLYAASAGINFVLLFVFTLTNHNADFLSFMFLEPFGLILLSCILKFLWLLAQIALKLVSPIETFYIKSSALNRGVTILLTSLLNFIIFVGIFVAGLSLTFSIWEAPFVSVRYFSCQLS
jgi:hypothetical protein